MRIAPKPTPGQEVSLERLLSPRPVVIAPVEPVLAVSIVQVTDGWVLEPVQTTRRPVRMEINTSELGPTMLSRMVIPNGLKSQGYRLIAADEFYGMLKLMYDLALHPTWGGNAKLLREDLFVTTKDATMLVNTSAQYMHAGQGMVMHREKSPQENRLSVYLPDLKWQERDVVEKIFGATDFQELTNKWRYAKNVLSFSYDIAAPLGKADPITVNLYFENNGPVFRLAGFEHPGITLFVKTTDLEETP